MTSHIYQIISVTFMAFGSVVGLIIITLLAMIIDELRKKRR